MKEMKKEQEENGYQDQNEKVQKTIDALKQKIKKEQQEIAAIDKQMAQMKEEHAREMQELQSQL